MTEYFGSYLEAVCRILCTDIMIPGGMQSTMAAIWFPTNILNHLGEPLNKLRTMVLFVQVEMSVRGMLNNNPHGEAVEEAIGHHTTLA